MATQDITAWLARFAPGYQEVRLVLERYKKSYPDAIADVTVQLKALFPDYYYLFTPWTWLREYPRYLKGIVARFEKIKSGGQATDRDATALIQKYQARYQDLRDRHINAGIDDPELDLFRWMIEEFRISLFAQKLGTAIKVAEVRLEKQWEKTNH